MAKPMRSDGSTNSAVGHLCLEIDRMGDQIETFTGYKSMRRTDRDHQLQLKRHIGGLMSRAIKAIAELDYYIDFVRPAQSEGGVHQTRHSS